MAVNGQLDLNYETTLERLHNSPKSVCLTIGRCVRPTMITNMTKSTDGINHQNDLQDGIVGTLETESRSGTGQRKKSKLRKKSSNDLAPDAIVKYDIIPGINATITLYRDSMIGLGFSIVGGSDTVLVGFYFVLRTKKELALIYFICFCLLLIQILCIGA